MVSSSAVNMLIQCVMRKRVAWFLLTPVTNGQNRPIVSIPFKTIHYHEQLHHLANLFLGSAKTKFGLLTWEMERQQGMGSPRFMLNDVIHTRKDLNALSIAAEIMAQLCTFLSHFFPLVQSHNAQGPFSLVQMGSMNEM